MQDIKLIDQDLSLPFGWNELLAGLRRYHSDVTLQIAGAESFSVQRKHSSLSRVFGLEILMRGSSGEHSCRVVVKEPRGVTRIGLAGVGKREVGVYRFLATQLPVAVPDLVACSEYGEWLVLDYFQDHTDPGGWTGLDYAQALQDLASLHDRFWDLGRDLLTYNWLARPLETDFEIHVSAAAKAIEELVYREEPSVLAGSQKLVAAFAALTINAGIILEALQDQPRVLLHGDYWPGNIAEDGFGRHIVYDWQHAAIGPAVLDLVGFCKKSCWWFDPLPIPEEQIVRMYRTLIQQSVGYTWTEDCWNRVWDSALMWCFLQDWVDVLAASPNSILEARWDLLERVWFLPILNAVDRWLKGIES
ncbi:MAG: aminoglycoside phosphotransferase family protein [Anaerolineales bacterium]|nr:aminoglycoside phosphotransferase family protein [Anaerolineales bacterium]